MIDIKVIYNKFINWTKLRLTPEQHLFILDNIADYNNLNNNSYWQRKMTPEEWEAKRHPNRSHRWVPQRLELERDELRYALFDILLGENNYAKQSHWYKGSCHNCGADSNLETQFRRDMTDCLKSKSIKDSEFLGELTPEEYDTARQDCWDVVTSSYEPIAYRSQEITAWSQRSNPWGGASYPYGLCGYCYQRVKSRMSELLTDAFSQRTF